jgi:peptidyl-tRNA hydrolase, PTH1 family
MKIIIGLGNPGKEYENTRHNIGFFFVDKLREEYSLPDFEMNRKFNAYLSKGIFEIQNSKFEILLVKPQTFMNLSGEGVQAILTFYKLTPDDIIVIHDDLDIPTGKYKIAADSSSAGHHGVEDIIEKLGTQKFKRIRIGIGEATEEGAIKCRLGAHDYVLDKFSEDELEKIKNIENDVLGEIKKLLQ